MRIFIAAACTLLVLLTGCTRTGTDVSRAGRHPWTQPHVLRVAELSDPDRLNPYLSEMDISYDLASLVYSYLVIADDRGRLIGDLAAAVPTIANGGISRDGRTYVYRLRHGVIWQDGVRFTARDVQASWKAVVDPRHDTFEREGYDRIASIDAPDPYTIVVRLRRRYPPFVSRFFAPLQEGGKPVLAAHVLARTADFNAGELNSHPVGTGPFRFVSWARGDRIVLAAFDRYFKGRPRLRRIELHFMPNDQTIAGAFAAHETDLIVSPQTSLINEYRAVPGATVTTAPWNAQAILIVNAQRPALADLSVRRALSKAIAYATILRTVTHGLYAPSRNSLPPTAIGYEALPARRYDPAAAARLLNAAGWTRSVDGIRTRRGVRLAFTLDTIAGIANLERMALLLQSSLRAAGIGVIVKTHAYRTIFAAPTGPIYGGSYDLALYQTTLNWDPDVYNFVACDRWYPQGQNVLRFCDRRLDALQRSGLSTDIPARRAIVYRLASRLMWSDVAYVPIYNLRRLIVASADLKSYSVNPTSAPWWNAYRWDI